MKKGLNVIDLFSGIGGNSGRCCGGCEKIEV